MSLKTIFNIKINIFICFIFIICCNNNNNEENNSNENNSNLNDTSQPSTSNTLNQNNDTNQNIGKAKSEDLKKQYDKIINIIKSSGLANLKINYDDNIYGIQLMNSDNLTSLENKINETLENKVTNLGIDRAGIGEKKEKKKELMNFIENLIGQFISIKNDLEKLSYDSIIDEQSKISLKSKNEELLNSLNKVINKYTTELHNPKYNPFLPNIPKIPYAITTNGNWSIKKRHVELRFKELSNILSDSPEVIAYFPGNSAKKHDLGTGIGKNQKKAKELNKLIADQIQSLINKFPNQIKFAFYNIKDPDRNKKILESPEYGVHQKWTSLKSIQIWGANQGNWNYEYGKKTSFGGGQAGGFNEQTVGNFGINTMNLNHDISIDPPKTNHRAKY